MSVHVKFHQNRIRCWGTLPKPCAKLPDPYMKQTCKKKIGFREALASLGLLFRLNKVVPKNKVLTRDLENYLNDRNMLGIKRFLISLRMSELNICLNWLLIWLTILEIRIMNFQPGARFQRKSKQKVGENEAQHKIK